MSSFVLYIAVLALLVASATADSLVANGNGASNNLPTDAVATNSPAICHVVEIDIYTVDNNNVAVSNIFQWTKFNDGIGANLAAQQPYSVSLPQPITNGAIQIQIVGAPSQGSYSAVIGVVSKSSARNTIGVTMNDGSSIVQQYNRGGNNFTLTGFVSTNSNDVVVVLNQIYTNSVEQPGAYTCHSEFTLRISA